MSSLVCSAMGMVDSNHSVPDCRCPLQVENFGLHINVDGSVMYGIYVEAIMHRKDDDISLDLLSRMLVDVHQVGRRMRSGRT